MSASYTAKEGGYAYLYVSNEHPTQVDVYFDDISMSYTPSRIIQSNEYYPFGAQTARSWTRESAVANNFLGNGGTEYNATSSQYDLDFRNYDPILGRLNQVDPMSNKYGGLSPYHFSANNPVSLNDPSGADYDISAGPYTAGTPWSHNWVTGRPANQEGRGDRLTREFWQRWNDDNDVRAGHMSEAAYAEKYSTLIYSASGSNSTSRNANLGYWQVAKYQLDNGEMAYSLSYNVDEVVIDARRRLMDGISQLGSGSISITGSSDQAIIDQFVKAIYNARAEGKSEINLRRYFNEYSLGKSSQRKVFAELGFGRQLKGALNLRDGGPSIRGVISISLSENWSVLPSIPNGNQGQGTESPNGDYLFFNYLYIGTPNNPAMIIKGYTPTSSSFDRLLKFIWGK